MFLRGLIICWYLCWLSSCGFFIPICFAAEGSTNGSGEGVENAISNACESARLYQLRDDLTNALDDEEKLTSTVKAKVLHTLSNLELILDANVENAVVRVIHVTFIFQQSLQYSPIFCRRHSI